MFTRPLDVRGLVEPVADEEPRRDADEGLVVGHVHLHVGDLDRGLAFYRDISASRRWWCCPERRS